MPTGTFEIRAKYSEYAGTEVNKEIINAKKISNGHKIKSGKS